MKGKKLLTAFLTLAMGVSTAVGLASCGEQNSIIEHHMQGLDFYFKDDGTYAVGVGRLSPLRKIVISEKYNDIVFTEVVAQGFKGGDFYEIILPETLTTIGDHAFVNCSNLTSISIPDGVITIGVDAFSGCGNLESVYITDIAAWCNISGLDNLTRSIGYKKLYLNNELVTELIIPDGVTTISDYAFYYCHGLTSVVIPDSVTDIGYYAFANTSLTSIYYGGTATEWGSVSIGINAWTTNATRYYYVENQADVPTDGGNYWHYDENGEIAVW